MMSKSQDDQGFPQRYGKWALIAGGSDGLGLALSSELAARGMNCLLVARRAELLQQVAAELKSRHGVETRTLVLDLAQPEASERLEQATADLDLGVVVFNAGAEASGALFVEAPYVDWQETLQRNVLFLTEGLYRFGRKLSAQGRGGLLVIGSQAAFGGGARAAIYTATKAYALNLGESIWAELKPQGVDVLTFLFDIADTPKLRSVLARKNIPVEATGAAAVEDLARVAIGALDQGPVLWFDEKPEHAGQLVSGSARRDRVVQVSKMLEGLYAPE